MLSKLLKSVARKKILEIFISNSRQKYYLRELAKMISYSPGSLQRELAGLADDGILEVEAVGNMKFFSLNTKSPLIKEVQRMLEKSGKDQKIEPKMEKRKAKNSAAKKQKTKTVLSSDFSSGIPSDYPSDLSPILSPPTPPPLEKPPLEKPKFNPYFNPHPDDSDSDGITLNIE